MDWAASTLKQTYGRSTVNKYIIINSFIHIILSLKPTKPFSFFLSMGTHTLSRDSAYVEN